MSHHDEESGERMPQHRAPSAIRAMAIERVRGGERPSEVIASYGFHRCTIYGWLKSARERGDDPLAKAAIRKPAGEPHALSAAQERQLVRWINGKSPLHYGLEQGLWTRELVCELVARRGGQQVPPASVEALLARLKLLPRKPLEPAVHGDDGFARWLRTQYPAIARKAKRDQAELYVWREQPGSDARAHGNFADASARYESPGAASGRQDTRTVTVSNTKGDAFWFTTYAGALSGRRCVELLRRLAYRRTRPLHLVLDGHPAHQSPIVRHYAASLGGKLKLHYLPGRAAAAPAVMAAWEDDILASEYLGAR